TVRVGGVPARVGAFGTDALAGSGMASRLDFLMIPLLFSLGTAATTMVGANIGARQIARARRIAWTAALLGAAVTETIGVLAALFPHMWIGIFSSDPNVVARDRAICAWWHRSTASSAWACCSISPARARGMSPGRCSPARYA